MNFRIENSDEPPNDFILQVICARGRATGEFPSLVARLFETRQQTVPSPLKDTRPGIHGPGTREARAACKPGWTQTGHVFKSPSSQTDVFPAAGRGQGLTALLSNAQVTAARFLFDVICARLNSR